MGPKRKAGNKNGFDKVDLNTNNQNEELDEAIEERVNLVDSDNDRIQSEGEGEDLSQDLSQDYQAIPELDQYEKDDLDDEIYSELDPEERKNAEDEIRKREIKNIKKSSRVPLALLEELDEFDEEEELKRKIRRQKMRFSAGLDENYEDEQEKNDFINKTEVKGKLQDWLKEVHVLKYVQNSFSRFIKNFQDENGNNTYEQRIIDMCTHNKQSLEINFYHLNSANQHLAVWVVTAPSQTLPVLNEVAYSLACEIFPNYPNIFQEIFVRIRDLPILDNLRELRHYHVNTLIKVRGVVTKRTNVFSQLKKIMFRCTKCGEKIGPFFYSGQQDMSDLGGCQSCQSKGPFAVENSDTLYRNYQKIVVQESPGTIPPGRIPRHKEVILTNDLVDSVKPGDEVEISGIYLSRFDMGMNIRYSFPVFSTMIEAVHIKRLNEIEIGELREEDKIEIRKLSKDPNIALKVFNSIAPSIYGHDFIKRALALAMFSGVGKDINGKHKIRGDINILLLGDPGTAKSQLLSYVNKVFHRSVYTTGKGASAVGLTAGVHKDPVTKEWTLEGGALVLADKGVCLIDEFDKMNDQDRTSIHEAMEQQSISISKAGIVTTLQARCSVIAAANPIKGRYDSQLTFSDNVDLTDPILSRFDILSVVKDQVDMKIDNALATFVINSHITSHPDLKSNPNIKNAKIEDRINEAVETIPQDVLRKYIMYARKFVSPKLNDINKNKLVNFYSQLRKESDVLGGLNIAVRHLESMIRIAESHAKIHLREYVRNDDIDLAIKIMLESFLQTQKYTIANNLRKNFGAYLIVNEEHTQLLSKILNKTMRANANYLKILGKIDERTKSIVVSLEAFEREAQDLGIYNLTEFYKSRAFTNRHRIQDKNIICDI